MINLIPPEAEKVVKREYMLRVGGTLALLTGAVFLALTVALIPTYVLIGAQIDTSVKQAEEAGLDEEFERADTEVRMTKEILNQLRSAELSEHPSAVIEELQSIAPSGISFGLFVFTDGKKTGAIDKIQIQGVASTREVLASFRSAVEASPAFSKAEVPIADLARDTNLPFTMTVIPEEEPT